MVQFRNIRGTAARFRLFASAAATTAVEQWKPVSWPRAQSGVLKPSSLSLHPRIGLRTAQIGSPQNPRAFAGEGRPRKNADAPRTQPS